MLSINQFINLSLGRDRNMQEYLYILHYCTYLNMAVMLCIRTCTSQTHAGCLSEKMVIHMLERTSDTDELRKFRQDLTK